MNIKINFLPLSVSIAAFIVAGMTVTYSIDKYIHFASEDNAMAFFLIASLLGVGGLIASFEKIKPVECSKDLDNEWYNESI